MVAVTYEAWERQADVALQRELCPLSAAAGTTERVLRDDGRQARGVQTFKAWPLADRRNQTDAVYGTSGPRQAAVLRLRVLKQEEEKKE